MKGTRITRIHSKTNDLYAYTRIENTNIGRTRSKNLANIHIFICNTVWRAFFTLSLVHKYA